MQQQTDKLKPFIKAEPQKMVIVAHYRPDADALGSSLALYHYLKKYKHDVTVVMPSSYPRFLFWMPEQEHIVVFDENRNKKQVKKLVDEAAFIFCLDFSRLSRINEMEDMVRQAPGRKVMMDHHLDPEDFAEFVFWDTSAAAAAEIVFNFIVRMGDPLLIDLPIAECIYAGILTDTGSFRHPCTSRRVHLIIAELITIGVDVSRVHKLIYDNNTEHRLRLLGYALSEKLTVLPEYQTAYITLSATDLEHFKSENGDTEGLVNYALSIENMRLAAIMIERRDTEGVKLSFRSVGSFSVNEFAQKHFGGGGHCNASGGLSPKADLAETEAYFRSLLPQYKEALAGSI